MHASTFKEKLERNVPTKMIARWIESIHSPNRELCMMTAADLRARVSAKQGEVLDLDSEAVHHFARMNARDAFVLQLISGPFSSVLVFFFDLHRSERHLSNLAGTLILVNQPDVPQEQWRDQVLNALAGVSLEASRARRARRLFRKMVLRNGVQTLAVRSLRRSVAKRGILAHLGVCGGHALWSYGEVWVAARDFARAKHAGAPVECAAVPIESSVLTTASPGLMTIIKSLNPFSIKENGRDGAMFN